MLLKGQAAFAYSAATDSSTIGSKWLASALTSVMPSLAAMARAVVQLSPVTMWQRRPLRLHLRATVGRGRQQIQGKPLLPVEHASLPTWTQRQRYCPFTLTEWHSPIRQGAHRSAATTAGASGFKGSAMASAAARRSGALDTARATSTQVAPSCSYRRIQSCTWCVDEWVGREG